VPSPAADLAHPEQMKEQGTARLDPAEGSGARSGGAKHDLEDRRGKGGPEERD
jgi:hypothetical protein